MRKQQFCFLNTTQNNIIPVNSFYTRMTMAPPGVDLAKSEAQTPGVEEKSEFELLLFKSKEAYVYKVPPAGTVCIHVA